jgi:hypothetical protein
MKVGFAFVGVMFFCISVFAADQPQIAIGVVHLKLGESQEAVLARLLEHYDVIDGGGVVEKENHAHLLGRIRFQNSRLALALRNCSQGDQKGDDYARAMVDAIRQMISEGRQQCVLLDVSQKQSSPQSDFEGAVISCGSKRLEISTTVYDGHTYGNLFEVIGSPGR